VEILRLRRGKTLEDLRVVERLLRPFGLVHPLSDSNRPEVYDWKPPRNAPLALVSEWTTEGRGRSSLHEEGCRLSMDITERLARPDRFGFKANVTWAEVLMEWATRPTWLQCARCTHGRGERKLHSGACNAIVQLLVDATYIPCTVEHVDALIAETPAGTLAEWWAELDARVETERVVYGDVPAQQLVVSSIETWT
jgi:hypothetical protein